VSKKKNILIVDDDRNLLDLFILLFEEFNFELTSATSGNSAFKILEETPQRFDYVLSDINMPDGDGVELLKKTMENIKNPPGFYLMTGYSDFDEETLLKLGAKEVFSKPIQFEEIIEKISSAN